MPNLTPQEAAIVANYVMAEKTAGELGSILDAVEKLRRWPHVRLAIADRLESSKLPDELLAEVASRALGAARLPRPSPAGGGRRATSCCATCSTIYALCQRRARRGRKSPSSIGRLKSYTTCTASAPSNCASLPALTGRRLHPPRPLQLLVGQHEATLDGRQDRSHLAAASATRHRLLDRERPGGAPLPCSEFGCGCWRSKCVEAARIRLPEPTRCCAVSKAATSGRATSFRNYTTAKQPR